MRGCSARHVRLGLGRCDRAAALWRAALAPHASKPGTNTHGGACQTLTLCDTRSICAANTAKHGANLFSDRCGDVRHAVRFDELEHFIPRLFIEYPHEQQRLAEGLHESSGTGAKQRGESASAVSCMSQAWHAVLLRA